VWGGNAYPMLKFGVAAYFGFIIALLANLTILKSLTTYHFWFSFVPNFSRF